MPLIHLRRMVFPSALAASACSRQAAASGPAKGAGSVNHSSDGRILPEFPNVISRILAASSCCQGYNII
jgi:hypothetical protein